MRGQTIVFLLLVAILGIGYASNQPEAQPLTENEGARSGKLLPVFQVVRFPNDKCAGAGGTRNGTCYTAEECSSKGGTSDGSCASGFGVCCVFVLSCGSTTSENNTYLVQSGVTTLTSPCNYKICPCSTNICRIRLDFDTFVIAPPYVIVATTDVTTGESIGDCTTDQMSVSAPGSQGSPVICGTNTGYHMIVDAADECNQVSFNIGADTTTTRQWTIRVTQYACGDYDNSGWPGCLQYYTAVASNIQSFNFPTGTTSAGSKGTHLSNQNYKICIRRASGYCYICYAVAISIAPFSFGLSVSPNAAAKSTVGTLCATDFIEIPNGVTAAIAATSPIAGAGVNGFRFCGHIFSSIHDEAAGGATTVCSRVVPFTVGVSFDDNEASTTTAAIAHESVLAPTGNIGFKLSYKQVTC